MSIFSLIVQFFPSFFLFYKFLLAIFLSFLAVTGGHIINKVFCY